ncbi:D-alanine--D-alanine ligase family protein [Legionella nagasakiensis]|uniref:D-alanine--D-alanine ligase family protein n=1 Tax=Legionella nagasakiensis TaxID=535290 RepID=UPI0010555CE8|nr:D-alanine--D-alanine ligase family protein [Legionella nagasakiensis]
MSNLINLLLLYGGKSGEHQISLVSAASVLANLDAARYNIIPVGMDKEGRFFLNQYEDLLSYKGSLPVTTPNSQPLPSLVSDGRLAIPADVVFPVVHGPLYEDGCLQGLLELADVAFVGCGVLSSAIGMDKDMARRLACKNGLKSARYHLIPWYSHSSEDEMKSLCQQIVAELGWPLFVKPCSMGSSVGIHKARNMNELLSAIDDARRYDEEVLIEEFISGREIELAVLENGIPSRVPQVSVAGEICVHHADGFYSYIAKYLESEQTELHVPAQLEDALLQRLQQAAVDVFTALKCKGMARVDFFVSDDGQIYFNEINTLPGFTPISMYPKLWQASGLSYTALIDQLIQIAMTHHRCHQQLVTDYQ